MGEATGYEELAVVVFGQFYGNMLAVGRGSFADVNCYVEDSTFDATDEFGLGVWHGLEMETSHHAIRGHGFVVLYEFDAVAKDWGHGFVEISFGETFEEVATCIAKDFWLYDYYTWDGGWDYVDHI